MSGILHHKPTHNAAVVLAFAALGNVNPVEDGMMVRLAQSKGSQVGGMNTWAL